MAGGLQAVIPSNFSPYSLSQVALVSSSIGTFDVSSVVGVGQRQR